VPLPYLPRRTEASQKLYMWINSGRLSTAVACLHLVPFFNVQWSMFNG
jgi:hypothetical protein